MSDIGFWSAAARQPDRTALVSDSGERITYAALLAEQNRVANGLAALGLRPGATVAVYLANQPEFVEVALACQQAGLYFLPLNSHLSAGEAAYILQDSNAQLFIGGERFAAVTGAAAQQAGLAPDRCFTTGEPGPFRALAELKADQPSSPPDVVTAGETMVYTSGTTGRPKGVRRPLSGVDPEVMAASVARLVCYFFGLPPGQPDVQLVTGPLYHTTPGGLAIAGLHLGHTVVLMDKWEARRTLDLIEQHRVSYSHMVPTMFHRLLALPEQVRTAADLSSLRAVLHGAAPCPIDVKRRMIGWFGPIITEYYGSSEGGGTLATSAEWLARPGTVGRPWPTSEIKVVDDDGADCKAGATGTVYIRMAGFEFEYHNDPDKTAGSTRDGFFTVGDIGHFDDDGYLFLSGRTSELIISGGANIYPAEIEGCLLEHPAVADVAVFGIPNPEWGEEVKAVVEVVAGVTTGPELEAELIAHCRDRLASYKAPRTVDFRASLPRTDAGKLYKRLLVQDYLPATRA